ncbi:Phospholipase A(1) DAD1, partial [Durusdinium trenchii]
QDIVIAYRGTTGIVEWLTDLAASPIPFQPNLDSEKRSNRLGRHAQAQAHQGFYDAFLASLCDINQKLMPQLRDVSRPKRLIIVGHSIGGAIAMGALGYLLQTYDFAASPHRILFVSTGQPRFGDQGFVENLEKQLSQLRRSGKCCAVRLVNDCDAVPTVPSSLSG